MVVHIQISRVADILQTLQWSCRTKTWSWKWVWFSLIFWSSK